MGRQAWAYPRVAGPGAMENADGAALRTVSNARLATSPKSAAQKRRDTYLKEWYATLEQLRSIGASVSRPENRPGWVNGAAPAGAQADQFLHAYYYQRTFDGAKANYPAHYEKNKGR